MSTEAERDGTDAVRVEVCARPPSTAFLVFAYNGRVPPTALFDDLAALGWTPPPPALPPRTAIDWSTPDPELGQRFTLLDWLVEDAIAEPPAGSGHRGSWTAEERVRNLVAVGDVLARHGVRPEGDLAEVARPAPPRPTPLRTPTPSRSVDGLDDLDDGPEVVGFALAVAPAAPAPVPGTSTTTADVADATRLLLWAEIRPNAVPRIEAAILDLGLPVRFVQESSIRVEQYRASTYETTVTRILALTIVDASQLAEALPRVERVLPGVAVRAATDEDELEVAAGKHPGRSTPVEVTERDDDPATRPEPVGPRIVLVVDPPRVADVLERIDELGLDRWRTSPASRTVLQRYRASTTERTVPAVRVEVWPPPAHLRLVVADLASVAGLDPSDERVHVEESPESLDDDPHPALGDGRTDELSVDDIIDLELHRSRRSA